MTRTPSVKSPKPLYKYFGEASATGNWLTNDKPDRHFTVITFLIDAASGVALDLKTDVPCYHVADEEGRIHLLLHLPIGEEKSL